MGIFGKSLKTDIVIPNKVFHYAAIGKCILTKDTPGIKEIFSDDENIILCNNTPRDIAEKIIFLKNNKDVILRIEKNANAIIREQFNEVEIAKIFIDILNGF